MSHPFLEKNDLSLLLMTTQEFVGFISSEKSEVENVFKNFYIMVQTQFHEKIGIF